MANNQQLLLGEGAGGGIPNYIEEVFSTYLYDGTGAAQTITNGIDLSTKGGLVWIKTRSNIYQHNLSDTARGATEWLNSASTDASVYRANHVTAFNTNGFSVGNSTVTSPNFNTVVSWTFRKQKKFFDVVTYTGNGVAGRTIAHDLGSVPGCIIVKGVSDAGQWATYHRSLGASFSLYLNSTIDSFSTGFWDNTTPTATHFSVASTFPNNSGQTYVAYLFAHDAGGFGLAGTDNVISCGTFTTDGSGNATVDLGYEPQWLMTKVTSTTGGWRVFDTMRGWSGGIDALLVPNNSGAEYVAEDYGNPTATGMNITNHGASITWIYIAIRRGPMKVPTVGTSVYKSSLLAGNSSTQQITDLDFPPDLVMTKARDTSYGNRWTDRLRGFGYALRSDDVGAELDNTTIGVNPFNMNGYTLLGGNPYNASGFNYVNHAFRRAPGFFDEVCYTGTGSALSISHNLGVTPELIIAKKRSATGEWCVSASALPYTSFLFLQTTAAKATFTMFDPVTASAFTVQPGGAADSGASYVAYLFATCAGVSKVGSYTGTAAAQVINCGFTAGARFVLIKKTSGTGSWYVWDSSRGIVAGNDPYLLLNSTAAEVTSTDYVDTASVGFEISSTAPSEINENGGSFIFLAIA